MPNSEDYTLVWAGISRELVGDEIAQAEAGVHPLMNRASSVALESWFDTFANDMAGEPVFSMLVGQKLDLLGYKEGRTQLLVDAETVQATLSRINRSLEQMGETSRAALYVLLRIQE